MFLTRRVIGSLMTGTLLIATMTMAAPDPSRARVCSDSPRPVSAMAPEFPNVGRQARVSGTVPVDVSIDEAGRVLSAKVVDGGPSMFEAASVAAAARWLFDSAPGCGNRKARLVFRFKTPVPSGWGGGTVFRPPYEVDIVIEEIKLPVERSN